MKYIHPLVSPFALLGFFIGIMVRPIGDNVVPFSNLVINASLLILFVRWSMILREIGSLLVAKLVGGTPHHIVMGVGKGLGEFEVWGVKIGVHQQIYQVVSKAYFDDLPQLKQRYYAYLVAPSLTCIVLAGTAFALWGHSREALTDVIHVSSHFIFANIYLLMVRLLAPPPLHQLEGFPDGGIGLSKLSETPEEDLVADVQKIHFSDATDYWKQGKFEKAEDIYLQYIDHSNQAVGLEAKFQLAVVHLFKAEFEASFRLFKSIENLINLPAYESYKATWASYVSWYYLIYKNDLANAEIFSKYAYDLQPNDAIVIHTRAAVLIEHPTDQGTAQLNEGVQLLENFPSEEATNNIRMSAMVYLFYGAHLQHNAQLKYGVKNGLDLNRKLLMPLHKYMLKRLNKGKD
jgi:tetratricopeptide (TPR) repeat protein